MTYSPYPFALSLSKGLDKLSSNGFCLRGQ